MRFEKDDVQSDNEEFEFKPLTQGLGFHPKTERSSKSAPINQSPAPASLKKPLSLQSQKTTPSEKAVATTPTPLRSTFLESPLPRPHTPTTPTPSNSGQAVESILKSLNEKNKNLQFSDKGKPISPYVQVSPGLAAGFLDLLLITSLGLIYMMSLIFTLKIDLIKTLAEGGPNVWMATAAVFLGVGFVYYTTQRIFLGFTLGDWAYEQRLGLPEEMEKPGYSLKVFWRQILIMATGIFILPLISWAVGRDLAGVSGLCVYRKR